uniref:Uncharacterized protein n=1 Tax=Heterorhabditis bacteriophora TaxID=37862 RepID=A0A1I7X4T4_HETBA
MIIFKEKVVNISFFLLFRLNMQNGQLYWTSQERAVIFASFYAGGLIATVATEVNIFKRKDFIKISLIREYDYRFCRSIAIIIY